MATLNTFNRNRTIISNTRWLETLEIHILRGVKREGKGVGTWAAKTFTFNEISKTEKTHNYGPYNTSEVCENRNSMRRLGQATPLHSIGHFGPSSLAGIASVTLKIKLFASTAILTLSPALCAQMAVTIDSIAPGRFGVNIVTDWQPAEYEQMNEYAQEYVQVMKDLWTDGKSDFKGKNFTMNDCKLSPKPSSPIRIVAAEKTGRDVGAMVIFTIIAYETDEEAQAKWDFYAEGVDLDATSWVAGQATQDMKANATATANRISGNDNPVNLNEGTLIGSFETVAKLLDEAAEIAGTKGIMMIFDDFLEGLDKFGKRIQPLMKCRTHIKGVAAK
ncbi:hypothetical protein G7Y89_g12829 [Cudoniella acicularis]|uniref:Luciferase-like domain-containing protein n=1 Tax=Cudoniella acicularis TaxID=354080 RepID=A0A8H4RAH2_9HELO|nr:hypothetical protein G7Y89_g12829 [Cudoniella acicularis]